MIRCIDEKCMMRYILKDAQNNMKRMKWVESDVCNEMHKII